jgi:predicted ribonuclease toxin of YeeF-YezG toxin-antitoxin module
MSKFTKLDSMLISEAYSAQLLVESAPYMTIAEIQSRLPHMTIAEAQVIEELFGKLGQRMGQVASGVSGVGGAALKGLKSAGQSAGRAISGAVDKGVEAATGVGRGIAGAASNVAQNVGNMYKAGAEEKEAAQAIEKAQSSIEELVNLINTAKSKYGPGSAFNKYFSDDPMKMTLSTIANQLNMASDVSQDVNAAAKDRGFFGGTKAAFSNAAQQGGSAPQGAPATP